jgi:hypothetical protein
VRLARHRCQDGQALSRDLDTVSAEQTGCVVTHDR